MNKIIAGMDVANSTVGKLFGPIRQVAYVVADLEQAMCAWHEQLGVGPFAAVRNFQPLRGMLYRGNPVEEVVASFALAYIGDVQLELIEQHSDGASIYREAIDQGAYGFHHYAMCSTDYDNAKKKALGNGFEIVMDSDSDAMCYMASTRIENLIIELVRWNDFTRPFFDDVFRFVSEADPNDFVHEYSFEKSMKEFF